MLQRNLVSLPAYFGGLKERSCFCDTFEIKCQQYLLSSSSYPIDPWGWPSIYWETQRHKCPVGVGNVAHSSHRDRRWHWVHICTRIATWNRVRPRSLGTSNIHVRQQPFLVIASSWISFCLVKSIVERLRLLPLEIYCYFLPYVWNCFHESFGLMRNSGYYVSKTLFCLPFLHRSAGSASWLMTRNGKFRSFISWTIMHDGGNNLKPKIRHHFGVSALYVFNYLPHIRVEMQKKPCGISWFWVALKALKFWGSPSSGSVATSGRLVTVGESSIVQDGDSSISARNQNEI